MKKTLLLLACCIAGFSAAAQVLGDNDLFYHAFRSPLSVRYNPALKPDSSTWYVTLPSVSVSAESPISYRDLNLTYDPAKNATILNINNLIEKLEAAGTPTVRVSTQEEIIGAGFSVTPRLRFNLGTGVKAYVSGSVPMEIIDFATQGNIDHEGNPVNLDKSYSYSVSAMAFGYLSVGGAYDLKAIPLSLGLRANILAGGANVGIDNLSLAVTTASDFTSIAISPNYQMHSAGIVTYDTSKMTIGFVDGQYIPKSLGFTFDIGAKYSFQKFDFSLSLLDVGPGIHWKQNGHSYTPQKESVTYVFSGVDVSAESPMSVFDTLFSGIKNLKQSDTSFWYTVPTKIYLGASYTFNRFVRVGYLFHGEWGEGWRKNSPFYFNNTLSVMGSLYDWLDISVANAFAVANKKADFFNPGISVSLNIGKCVQFYVSADYVSNMYVVDMKSVRLLAGINIVGYHKTKTKTKTE